DVPLPARHADALVNAGIREDLDAMLELREQEQDAAALARLGETAFDEDLLRAIGDAGCSDPPGHQPARGRTEAESPEGCDEERNLHEECPDAGHEPRELVQQGAPQDR